MDNGFQNGEWNNGTNENGANDNGIYVNGAYNTGAYGNAGYDSGTYGNGAYNNGAYNKGTYNNGAYNNGMYNNSGFAINTGAFRTNGVYDPEEQYVPAVCPGKEITGLIFGIVSLLSGLTSGFFGIAAISLGIMYNTFYGRGSLYSSAASSRSSVIQIVIYAILYGIMTIAFAIVTMVLRRKVMLQADAPTKKIRIGFGLAIAGMILGALAVLLGIIGASML